MIKDDDYNDEHLSTDTPDEFAIDDAAESAYKDHMRGR